MPTIDGTFIKVLWFASKRLIGPEYFRAVPGLSTDEVTTHTFIREGTLNMLFEGLFNVVKATMVFSRLGDDVAVIDMHHAPIRGALIADSPALPGEMDKIHARADTLFNALNGFFDAELAYDRLVFHDAGPKITDAGGFTLLPDGTRKKDHPSGPIANPALRTDVIVGANGDSASAAFLPPQVAVSVTFKTASRRNWGRVYVPAGDVDMIAGATTHSAGLGQLDDTKAAAIASAFADYADGCASDDVPLVVWSPTHQHAQTVDVITVDTLFDVIRSRRWKRAHGRTSHTVA